MVTVASTGAQTVVEWRETAQTSELAQQAACAGYFLGLQNRLLIT
jgi:hypothetical protein